MPVGGAWPGAEESFAQPRITSCLLSSSALRRAQFHPIAFAAPERQHRGRATNFKPLTFVSCASESPGHHGSYVEPIEEGKKINKIKSQFAT